MKEALKRKFYRIYFGFYSDCFSVTILGARLYYVLFRLDYYHLQNQVKSSPSGMVVWPFMGFDSLDRYIFADRKLINTWDFLDIAAPSVMVAKFRALGTSLTEAYGAAVDSLDYLPGYP